MNIFQHNHPFNCSVQANRNIFFAETPNLDKYVDIAKNNVTARIEFQNAMNDQLASITEIQQEHSKILAEMQKELAQNQGQAVKREFPCLGEKFLIVLDNQGYEEYLITNKDKQPINFLQWAIENKNHRFN